ncbi:MAG: ketoacyl-ACP synthase III [Desulfobacterales bacterium]|nr:ketoacyl-ACP synthase III [Desulfobacterales bacterium]
MHAIITAVGHYVPDKRLTNKDLEQMVDTNDEWIRTRTGIRERRILEKDKGTSYMAVESAKMVLAQRKISAADLDLIIVATTTPDMTVPPTAALVQKELGAVNCWGFDLNGACSGFLFALATGAQFIESGRHRKVLVIGADKMSAIIDYQDRNTCILFGDAGGAVLLEPTPEKDLGIKDFTLHLDGSGADFLRIAAGGSLVPTTHETVENRMHYLYQDGKTVFKFAVNGMTDVVARILKKNNLNGSDIKLFIPHQANYRIIDAVAKKIGLRPDQVMLNIEKYGNTTAATIPLAMSEAYQQQLMRKGDWIVIAAFGAGFTWGSLLLKWAID